MSTVSPSEENREEGTGSDFEGFGQTYLVGLVRYAYACLGSREDAEDVAMEALARAYELGPRFMASHNPRLYLVGIARRSIVDRIRSRKRQGQRVPLLESMPDGQEHRHVLIGEALSELPDAQREVLVMKYLEGFSVREIAKTINRSNGAVNSLLQRARASFEKQARALGLAEESHE